jgi:hypothetical protein
MKFQFHITIEHYYQHITIMKRVYTPDNYSIQFNDLIEDIQNIILKESENIYCTIVCKQWQKIILKNSHVCKTCNKITKIYDNVLWITDNDDPFCCGYFGESLKNYKAIKGILNKNYHFIRKIHQSIGVCYAAVKSNGHALKYIKKQPDIVCLEAVKNYPCALSYVENQTDEICLAALKKNGKVLRYVKINQTDEMCLEAVKNNPCALSYVENQTDEICLAALKKNGGVLRYVKINQTDEMCLEAVTQNGLCLQWVKNKTDKIVQAALNENTRAFKFVENQTREMCLEAIRQDPNNFRYIHKPHRTEELYIELYKIGGDAQFDHPYMFADN